MFNAPDIDVTAPDSLFTARTAVLTYCEAVPRLGVRLGVLLEGRSLESTGLYAGLEPLLSEWDSADDEEAYRGL